MQRTHFRKILSDVFSRKVRTILVSASVFIGVLGVVTLYSLGDIIITALEDAIDEDRLAMIYVYLVPDDTFDSDVTSDEYMASVRENVPDLTDAQGMTILPFYWWLPNGDLDEAPNEGRLLAYSEPFDALPLEPIELVDGRFPDVGNREIAVERRFAETHGVTVDDSIVLRLLGTRDSDTSDEIGQQEEWTIVGIVFQPYQYPFTPGSATNILGENMIFAHSADSNLITGYEGFNRIITRFEDFETAQANTGLLESVIAESTPFIPLLSIQEDPENNSFIEQTRTFGGVFSLLAFIALAVAGFLVFNVINTLVQEQRNQIGIMKSLGASESDIFFIFMGITFIYGILGVVPGVLLGIPAGFGLAESLSPQFNIFIDEFQLSRNGILIGSVMGMLIPMIAALLPILMGMRATILEAITDIGIDSDYRRGPLTKIADSLPVPMNIKQAFRNVLQKKGRLALTVITLAFAIGAFMGVYAEIVSLNAITDNIFNTFGQQVTVFPRGDQDFEEMQMLLNDEVDGIRTVARSTWTSAQIEGYTPQPLGTAPAILSTYGFDYSTEGMMSFDWRDGEGWDNDPSRNGVVITAGIADILDKTVGDDITLTARDTAETFEIIGVTTYPFDGVWLHWEDLARLGGITVGAPTPNEYYAVVSLDESPTPAVGLDEIGSRVLPIEDGERLTIGENEVMITQSLADSQNISVNDTVTVSVGENSRDYTVSGIFTIPDSLAQPNQSNNVVALYWEELADLQDIDLSESAPDSNAMEIILEGDDPTTEEVRERISEMNEVFLANGINATFINWTESAELIGQLIITGGLILNIAATLIGLVGAIGLLSTLYISVFERQKEIGVMRSVGASSSTISVQFLIEGLIVGIIAWAIGLPISYVINQALVSSFGFDGVPGFQYPIEAPILGFILTLIIATFSSLWPSIAAARKTVSDILRYQ